MRLKQLPSDVLAVLRRLRAKGHLSYLVGGSIRDLLLGHRVLDWDIATPATPHQIEVLFGKRCYDIGRAFGTMGLRGKTTIELTTFRRDGTYRDARHPTQVGFVKDIHEDLSRRDFTVNAMAYDPLTATLLDPFGGQKDLERGRLSCVGDANLRFQEDALRMLRAARFIAQLGVAPDVTLSQAAREHGSRLQQISKERLCDELSKLLIGPHVSHSLTWLRRVGLAPWIFGGHDIPPQTARHFKDYRRIQSVSGDVRLLLLGISPDIVSKALGLSAAHRRRLEHIKAAARRAMNISNAIEARRLISDTSEAILQEALQYLKLSVPRSKALKFQNVLRLVSEQRRRYGRLDLAHLCVSGRDVQRWRPELKGPHIGAVLDSCLSFVIERPSRHSRRHLKEHIVTWTSPT